MTRVVPQAPNAAQIAANRNGHTALRVLVNVTTASTCGGVNGGATRIGADWAAGGGACRDAGGEGPLLGMHDKKKIAANAIHQTMCRVAAFSRGCENRIPSQTRNARATACQRV